MKPSLKQALYPLCALAFAPCVWATPRVDSDSLAMRHYMQALRDSEYGIESAVLTWPWPLGRNTPATSEDAATNSLAENAYDRFSLLHSGEGKLGFRPAEVTLSLASDTLPFRSYRSQPREQFEAKVSQAWLSEWFAGNLSLGYADDPLFGDSFRLDGSYLAVALGNWSLALDQVDRWWGPGWDGSLILSNNARPIPAVSLTRIAPDAFRSKWLNWLGPWTFTTFMGQLENDEGELPGSNAQLFGMRIDFSPFGWDNLDIGLSRTAQWAGEGRPDGLDTFWKLFIGEDNRVNGVTRENEPGNQLAGIDYRLRIPGTRFAHYLQIIGEDEETYLPDANMIMGGLETWGDWGSSGSTWRAYFEWADTRAGYLIRDPRPNRAFNTAYNHSIYRTGYRSKGKSIGHALDGDGVMRSLGGFITDNNGNLWGAKYRDYSTNRDGYNRSVPHSVSEDPIEGESLELFAELEQLPFLSKKTTAQSLPKTKLNLGLHWISQENQRTGTSDSEIGGHISVVTQF